MSAVESLRVGYVLKRYPRYSETFIVNEILAHEAAGLDVEIFALRQSCDTHFQDIISRVRAPVTYLPAEGLKAIQFWETLEQTSEHLPGLWRDLEIARGEDIREIYQAVLLAREIRLKNIQHLHAHFATSATGVARLAARFADVPYTFTTHAKDIFHESVDPADLRRKFNDARAVITVSDYNQDFLRRAFGPAVARLYRIYNGLDLNQFPYAAPNERAPRIVAVGRLIEKKGFHDLIDACAILDRNGRNFECEIIGTGELEGSLRARIEQLDLHQRVRLLGPRPQREVIAHVQAAAAFAAPCVVGSDNNQDGLPTVLLEAMALGTPCVATAVTGIPEAVRDGVTGLIVPQHDPATLAVALERLLTDAALRERLARGARRHIEQAFDIHGNTAQQREIFHAAARPGAERVRAAV
ncbi:MAG: glycosyltransferase [Gammaproteobacteria bacterium]